MKADCNDNHSNYSTSLCARLSWLLVSFQVHIKSLHIIIIIITCEINKLQ